MTMSNLSFAPKILPVLKVWGRYKPSFIATLMAVCCRLIWINYRLSYMACRGSSWRYPSKNTLISLPLAYMNRVGTNRHFWGVLISTAYRTVIVWCVIITAVSLILICQTLTVLMLGGNMRTMNHFMNRTLKKLALWLWISLWVIYKSTM